MTVSPTTHIHQAIVDHSIPPDDHDNYLDRTELLGHNLETGELRAFKAVSNRRQVLKLKTFVEHNAFGDNADMFQEWVNADKEVRERIFEKLLQRHTLQKNSNLKVIAASTVPHPEPPPMVTNNYYGPFSDEIQYQEELPSSSNS